MKWGTDKLYRWGGMDNKVIENTGQTNFTNSITAIDTELDFGVYVKNSHIWEKSTVKAITHRLNFEGAPLDQSRIWVTPYQQDYNPELEPLTYSKFYVQITFVPDDGTDQIIFKSNDLGSASSFYNRDTAMYRNFYTHLGDRPTVDFYFDTAGMSWYDIQQSKAYPLSTNTAREYPEVITDATAYPHNPVYIGSNSNKGRGLICWIHQADTVLGREPDMARQLSKQALNWNVRNYSYFTYIVNDKDFEPGVDDMLHIRPRRTFTGNVRDSEGKGDDDYQFYRDRSSFDFNLRNAKFQGDAISMIPSSEIQAYNDWKQAKSNGSLHKIHFASQIFFSGNIVDRSGRAAFDARRFTTIINPDQSSPKLVPNNTINVSESEFGIGLLNIYLMDSRLSIRLHSALWEYTSSKPYNTTYDNPENDGGMFNHGWYQAIDVPGSEVWTWNAHVLRPFSVDGSITERVRAVKSNSFIGSEVRRDWNDSRDVIDPFQGNAKRSFVYWFDDQQIGDINDASGPFPLVDQIEEMYVADRGVRRANWSLQRTSDYFHNNTTVVLNKSLTGWSYPLVMFMKREI